MMPTFSPPAVVTTDAGKSRWPFASTRFADTSESFAPFVFFLRKSTPSTRSRWPTAMAV